MHERNDDRSVSGNPGSSSISASCIGTPPMLVMRSRSIAASVARADHRGGSTAVDRLAMNEPILVMNPMCAIGIVWTPFGSGSGSSASSMRRTASSAAAVNVAPRGRPVVPLV